MERHGLQRGPTAGWVIEREPASAETAGGSVDGAPDEAPLEALIGQPGGEAA